MFEMIEYHTNFQNLHYGVRGLAVVRPVVPVKNLEHEHVKRIVMAF